MKQIVHNRLYNYMTINSLMNKSQYGFRKGHYTINVVSKFTYDTLLALELRKYNLSVFLDLSKAFDTINHIIYVKQLCHYGIRGAVLPWSGSEAI